MTESSQAFGRRLRDLRLLHGVSQVELAGEELSASYISRLEAGQRVPTDSVVRLLAKRLGCRVEDLLFGENATTPQDVELELRHAELALRSGAVQDAVARFERLAALPTQPHLDPLMDAIELGYAQALEAAGDLEAALARYLQVSAGDPASAQVHQATIGACRCYLAYGDLVQALETGEQLHRWLAEAGALGTDAGIELTTLLAAAYQERGDLAAARRLAAGALDEAQRLGDPTALAGAYRRASLAASERGETADALRLAERGLAALTGAGTADPAPLQVVYGGLLLHADPPAVDEAIRVLSEARSRLGAPHQRMALAACLTELARAQLLAGERDRAVEAVLAAEQAAGGAPVPDAVRPLLVHAAALLTGESTAGESAAGEVMARARRLLAGAGPTRPWARAWREYGDLLARLGRRDDALAAYDEALRRTGLGPAAGWAPRPARHGRRPLSTNNSHGP